MMRLVYSDSDGRGIGIDHQIMIPHWDKVVHTEVVTVGLEVGTRAKTASMQRLVTLHRQAEAQQTN